METAQRRSPVHVAFRISVVLLILWATLPIYFTKISSGLDPSWIYVANVAGPMGLKFGEDVFFTCGPLGFLGGCIAVGANAAIYFGFFGILFGLLAWLLFEAVVRSNQCRLAGAVVSAALVCGAGSVDADYYVSYAVLLSIGLAWFGDKKRLYYSIACVLAAVLAFIKFSGCVLALSALLAFVVLRLFLDGKAGLRYLWMALSVPVLFVVGYLAYNPSVSALKDYVAAAAEISSGYNSSMSLPPPVGDLALALACLACYGGSLALVLWADRGKGLYMLAFCGAFFMAFKHGFVRADHAPVFFKGVLLWTSLFALFLDYGAWRAFFKRRKAPAFLLAVLVLLLPALPMYYLNKMPGRQDGVFKGKIRQIAGVKDKLANPLLGGGNRLPEEFLAEIGESTVAVYPAQQSIGAYNDVRMKFLPLLQSYSAYTPRLDKLNADLFGGAAAPECVVFDLGTIDIRLALIECPLTWLEIFSRYAAVDMRDGYLLLKKTDRLFEKDFRRISSATCRITDPIAVPKSDNVVAMQIDLELNGLGKLFKWFYQVPPVFYMRIDYAGGATLSGRAIPDNLASPTLINYYPDDLEKAARLLNTGRLPDAVAGIQFSGNSLRFYKREATVAFFESRTAKPTQVVGDFAASGP